MQKKKQFKVSIPYNITKKLSSVNNNHATFLLKHKTSKKWFSCKQYIIETSEEYLAFEQYLSHLIDMANNKEVQGFIPLHNFHQRNVERDFELLLLYPKMECSLREQMTVLGHKIKMSSEQAQSIFTEIAKIILNLHVQHFLYLGLKPENIFFDSDGSIVLADSVFNTVCLKAMTDEVKSEREELKKRFGEFNGKNHYTYCVFDNGMDTSQKTVRVPQNISTFEINDAYCAPEIKNTGFLAYDFSDFSSKYDVFSLGVSTIPYNSHFFNLINRCYIWS